MAGSGRAAPRSGPPYRLSQRLGRSCDRLGQRADDLAQGAGHRVVRIVAAVVAVEHRHHQSESLGGTEHQRRQPYATPHPIAPVRSTDRGDRDPRLAQDRDVATDCPLGHPEPLRQSLGGDAGTGLHQLQRAQRPCRRTQLITHRGLIPEGDRPQLRLASRS